MIVDRIRQYHEVGVDLILTAFLHYQDELPHFGRTVIPLVQKGTRASGPITGASGHLRSTARARPRDPPS